MGILVMELDLTEEEVFHFQVAGLVKICFIYRPTQRLEHTLTAEKMY